MHGASSEILHIQSNNQNCEKYSCTSFTRAIFEKDAPLRYTAAERWRFPAGVLPRTGWLFQCLQNLQWGHRCSTDRNVPSFLVLTSHARVQTGHTANNSIMQLSYTMYFLLLWVGVDDSCLHQTKGKHV